MHLSNGGAIVEIGREGTCSGGWPRMLMTVKTRAKKRAAIMLLLNTSIRAAHIPHECFTSLTSGTQRVSSG